eukprot:TRINITY_DN617_c0_g1_i3.p1 TRINITY_DN617_c0_g1~~TRINITY_DN617_c0_g1_i3.p1  ORF type:complete len:165 (-),score=24.93 TRINITY_DN617_c0_g1_i3:63-557(-)
MYWLRDWSETTFYFSEQHWSRLAYHIPLRGANAGAAVGFALGLPMALFRRPQPMARTIGAATTLFGVLGTTAMGVATVNKFQTLDQAGIVDRSYRLAHNWGQVKWDALSVAGFSFGFLFGPTSFGGRLRTGFVGMAIGTFAWAAQNAISKTHKTDVEALKNMVQ